jgi:hypothetical protein
LQKTFNFTPFIVLAIDVQRRIWICGNESGDMFLATEEFCAGVEDHYASTSLSVYHTPDISRREVRLPLPDGVLIGDRGETVFTKPFRMEYGDGYYAMFALYHQERKLWILQGELRWYSPLDIELGRNANPVMPA